MDHIVNWIRRLLLLLHFECSKLCLQPIIIKGLITIDVKFHFYEIFRKLIKVSAIQRTIHRSAKNKHSTSRRKKNHGSVGCRLLKMKFSLYYFTSKSNSHSSKNSSILETKLRTQFICKMDHI